MTFNEFKIILDKFKVTLNKHNKVYIIDHFKVIKFEEYVSFACIDLDTNIVVTYMALLLEVLKIITESISILYENEYCCILDLNFKVRYIYSDINKDIYEFMLSVLSKECPIPIFLDWLKEKYPELINV